MSARQSDAYYRDLERRARELRPLAETVLAADAYKWFVEFIDAGEYGLAVGVAAKALPSARTVPAETLRFGLTGLAETMGIGLPDTAN